MNNNINSKYNHFFCENEFSDKLFEEQSKFNKDVKTQKDIYKILLPPPNVTGKLHLGHAWNVSIQDCLIRYNHLKNKNAYWICGMDHAGIATQSKYESFMKSENKEYKNNSRDENIKNLYEWSQINASSIRNQWKKMGCFLDYDEEWFTLQKESNEKVIDTFVQMYNDKLIYRAKKLVNWDWKLKTAISNIEVIKKETNSFLYTIKYFFENSNNYLEVSTTRPETIFVDECLIINPNDKRYFNIESKKVVNPLTKKTTPIIFDEYVDISFGTGVMKCTPAHDFNDYELGKKYNLDIVSCFTEDGRMNEYALNFQGLSINECRKKVIQYFKENNLLVKEEQTISSIGYSERSGVVVEPMLSLQWFIKMKDYAQKIIENQKTDKKVNFYPIRFEKMLINWLENINDWCISRQLWWGHQIPVWYKKNSDEIYVSKTPPLNEDEYIRDNDVLDTWFSSGLWPITVSCNNENLLPTNVLVTAFDIIFFWVSRMMFFSLYLKDNKPFNDVYITGLIRDSQNRKMSKSLGNGIDPNDVINQYGADSLRLFLLSSSSPGEDLIYSEQKIKSCWGLINKLWNSFRYIQIKSSNFVFDELKKPNEFSEFDKWILNRFTFFVSEYNKNFENYNFLIAIKKITSFVWDDFCNTYIELNKNRSKLNESYLWTLNFIFKNILIILHPICPFVTFALYNQLEFINKKDNILYETNKINLDVFKESNKLDLVLLIINRIRTYVFDNKIPKNQKILINVEFRNETDFFENDEIKTILLCSNIELSKLEFDRNKPDFVESDFSIYILNKNEFFINQLDKEKINKEIEKLNQEILRCDSMLNNKNFIEKAPLKKIEEEKNKKINYQKKLSELEKLL